jgi:hypothetical protein
MFTLTLLSESGVIFDIKGRAMLGGGLVVVFEQYQPARGDGVIPLINFTDSVGDFAFTRVEGREDECVHTELRKETQRYALLLSVSNEDGCDAEEDGVDWRIIVGVVAGVVFISIIVAAVLFWIHRVRSI